MTFATRYYSLSLQKKMFSVAVDRKMESRLLAIRVRPAHLDSSSAVLYRIYTSTSSLFISSLMGWRHISLWNKSVVKALRCFSFRGQIMLQCRQNRLPYPFCISFVVYNIMPIVLLVPWLRLPRSLPPTPSPMLLFIWTKSLNAFPTLPATWFMYSSFLIWTPSPYTSLFTMAVCALDTFGVLRNLHLSMDLFPQPFPPFHFHGRRTTIIILLALWYEHYASPLHHFDSTSYLDSTS